MFTVKNGEQIFLAAVSDAQWLTFCGALGLNDLNGNPLFATNNDRVRERLARRSAPELAALLEAVELPFAPIRKPEELFDDAHLLATGGLADIILPDGERAGQTAQTTLFPFTMDGQRLGVRLSPPTRGQHTAEILAGLGYTAQAIKALHTGHAAA